MTQTNAGWPTRECNPNWLDYDWYSGLWEISDAAWADSAVCRGFVEWSHDFMVPWVVR